MLGGVSPCGQENKDNVQHFTFLILYKLTLLLPNFSIIYMHNHVLVFASDTLVSKAFPAPHLFGH